MADTHAAAKQAKDFVAAHLRFYAIPEHDRNEIVAALDYELRIASASHTQLREVASRLLEHAKTHFEFHDEAPWPIIGELRAALKADRDG